jgi:hypothetical protein
VQRIFFSVFHPVTKIGRRSVPVPDHDGGELLCSAMVTQALIDQVRVSGDG